MSEPGLPDFWFEIKSGQEFGESGFNRLSWHAWLKLEKKMLVRLVFGTQTGTRKAWFYQALRVSVLKKRYLKSRVRVRQ